MWKKTFNINIPTIILNSKLLLGIYMELWVMPKIAYRISKEANNGIFNNLFAYFHALYQGIGITILNNTPKFMFKETRRKREELMNKMQNLSELKGKD